MVWILPMLALMVATDAYGPLAGIAAFLAVTAVEGYTYVRVTR